MARLSFFISLGLVFSSLPSGLAGPACARRHYQAADCVQRCKSKWGWTGALMNTDPWGSVITKVDVNKDIDAFIAKACGTTKASTTSVVASTSADIPRSISTALSTESVTSIASSVVSPASQTTTFIRSTTSAISSSASRSSSSLASPSSSIPVAQGFVVSRRPSSSATVSTARATTSNAPVVRPITTPAPVKATTTASKPVVTSAAPPAAVNNGGNGATSQADIQAYLAGHNTIRAQHGASPLTWSDNLAAKAQQWANGCKFQHSGGSLGPFGENLAAGTGSDYDIAAAIKSWTDEVSQYNPNSPTPSHFTQVVWKGTSQVGCAVQTCSGIFDASFGPAKYFVCEYSAQGNIIGRFPENVQV
ncbi:PR-1-like protein [Agrocybe pediades]|nr:PR-1-like protein [Agrocybe pediades]